MHDRPRLGAVLARAFAVAERAGARSARTSSRGRRRPQPHDHRLARELALGAVGAVARPRGSRPPARCASAARSGACMAAVEVARLQVDGQLAAPSRRARHARAGTRRTRRPGVRRRWSTRPNASSSAARCRGSPARPIAASRCAIGVGQAGGRLRSSELGEHRRARRVRRAAPAARARGSAPRTRARPAPARAAPSRAGAPPRRRRPRAPASSRCALTRSPRAPDSISSRAARRWVRARSPNGSPP